MGNNRNLSLDLARGCLILLIVTFTHAFFWYNICPGSFKTAFLFEMPLLFIISGYSYHLSHLNSSKPINTTKKYFKYIHSRFLRILIPYFFYSIICILIVCVFRYNSHQFSGSFFLKAIFYWLNPITIGNGYSLGMLNYHLWFIPTFLLVSCAFPFGERLLRFFRIPFYILIILFVLLISLISNIHVSGIHLIQSVIFYLFWATLGMLLASGYEFKLIDYIITFSAAISSIPFIYFFHLGSLDMQLNKFPPNWIFAIFSTIWVIFFIKGTKLLSKNLIDKLSSSFLLKPFIKKGYSIYLWQGVGYTLASTLSNSFHLPTIIKVCLSVLFSVFFGIAAYPVEALKLTGKKVSPMLKNSMLNKLTHDNI